MPTNDFMGNGHTRANNSVTPNGEAPPNEGTEAPTLSATTAPAADDAPPLVVITGDGRFSFWEMRGTRGQLEAEGVIPAGTEWPKGGGRLHWQSGNNGEFSYLLRRTRPAGLKGPMRLWTNGDLWVLRCGMLGSCRGALLIEEKRKALADELHRQSHQGRAERYGLLARLDRAAQDSAFQAFKAKALPQPKGNKNGGAA